MNAGLQFLMVLASFVLLGLFLNRVSSIIHIPDVVLFLLAGLALGIIGWRPFVITDVPGQAFTAFAAAYILFQGGEAVELTVLRQIWVSVLLLSTLGVVITMVVVGVVAAPLLAVSLPVGLLVGAVVAATDPAVLIPIYRGLAVPGRVAQLIISESALNDATGAMCALVMAHVVLTQTFLLWYPVLVVLQLAALGIAVGLVAGVVYVLLTRERTGVLAGQAGILVLPLVIVAYVGATVLGGSGLIATFTSGVVAANHIPPFRIGVSDLTRRMAREYASSTTVVVRALLFFSLGASLDLARLNWLLFPALAVVLVLILVARPIAVIASTMPDRNARWGLRELVLFSWTRETGVVPGALSVVLLSQGIPGAQVVAGVAAVAIVVTVLLQATTTPWLVRKLRFSGLASDVLIESAAEP